MTYLFCSFLIGAIIILSFRRQTASDAWRKTYDLMLTQLDALMIELKSEQKQSRDLLQQIIEITASHATLQGQIEEMSKGRQFDQVLLKSSLERAERFRRVLEAVLRSQGCDDAQIALVLTKADNDTPIDE